MKEHIALLESEIHFHEVRIKEAKELLKEAKDEGADAHYIGRIERMRSFSQQVLASKKKERKWLLGRMPK